MIFCNTKMKIEFQNVIPDPLRDGNYKDSEIWDKQIQFEEGLTHLVKASSGTGKITFISIIYGIRRDYSGSVQIDGEEIRRFVPKKIMQYRRENMSIVFQGLMIFDELTALENIQLKNQITNFNNDDKIHELAKKLDVENLLSRDARILSFGQKQRIAIIRAMCQPFKFLLLDEPFSHLDEENAEKCLNVIFDECAARKSGMILTSLGNDYNGKYDKIIKL